MTQLQRKIEMLAVVVSALGTLLAFYMIANTWRYMLKSFHRQNQRLI